MNPAEPINEANGDGAGRHTNASEATVREAMTYESIRVGQRHIQMTPQTANPKALNQVMVAPTKPAGPSVLKLNATAVVEAARQLTAAINLTMPRKPADSR